MTHELMCAERHAFWTDLSEAMPELGIQPSDGWEKEIPLSRDGRIRLKMSLSQDKTSVYLVARSDEAKTWIVDHLDDLAKELRTIPAKATPDAQKGRWFRRDNKRACVTQRRNWPEAIRWLNAQHMTFSKAVRVLDEQ